MNGDGSIPDELAFLAPAVSPEPSKPCYPISALALALRLLSSEPHRVRRRGDESFPSEGFSPTLARWGRVSSLTLEAYWGKVMTLPRVNGSPRVADFGSQGTAGSPILLPPPNETLRSCHINTAPGVDADLRHDGFEHHASLTKPMRSRVPTFFTLVQI